MSRLPSFHPHVRRRRALMALLWIAVVFTSLGAAFFRTQIVKAGDYVVRADENRTHVVAVPAPRGDIVDREGRLLAGTRPRYSVWLVPDSSAAATWDRLARGLQLRASRRNAIRDRLASGSGAPIEVLGAVSYAQAAWVEEHRAELPGVILRSEPRRHYPAGPAAAHLIGYVGEISAAELARTPGNEYRPGQRIGKAGLERRYDPHLTGRAGRRYYEVDAHGRRLRPLAPDSTIPPLPGRDLRLALDLPLQLFIDSIFPRHLRGAVAALEPATGEVLALYSFPSFDPNVLVQGADTATWRDMLRDPADPLLNRAVAGLYAPGSTWKLATALIALETDLINGDSRMPIACSGGLRYAGRYARCWKKDGHGDLDLVGAIGASCNVYFYQLGIRLGFRRLAREGTRLGFSRETGIDLPGERSGVFPADLAWYRDRFGDDPATSEVMSLAIGQGPNSQTPLRMAQFMAALANGGTVVAPRLRHTGNRRRGPETDLSADAPTLAALREGMAAVVAKGGTAHGASLDAWALHGKTGTSQNSADPERPHAWFSGFAGPHGRRPEIAIAVLVEFGGSGSAVAAPLAAKIVDHYLRRRHDMAVPRLQTRAERAAGRPFRAR